MKKNILKYSLFTIFFVLYKIQIVFSAETNSETYYLDFLWKVINFFILIFIIYFFSKKPISNFLKKSSQKIKTDYDEIKNQEENAILRMNDLKKKIEKIERQTDEMILKARNEAKKEKDILLENARLEIDKMKERASLRIEQEYHKTEQIIKEKIANESVLLAKNNIEKKINKNIHGKLIDDFISKFKIKKEFN